MNLERRLGRLGAFGAGLVLAGGVAGFSERARADYVQNIYGGAITFDGLPIQAGDGFELKMYWEGDYDKPLYDTYQRIEEGEYFMYVWADQSGLVDFGLNKGDASYVPLVELGPDEAMFDSSEFGRRWHVDLEYSTGSKIFGNVIVDGVINPESIGCISDPPPAPPEPSTFLLFGGGLLAFGLKRRR